MNWQRSFPFKIRLRLKGNLRSFGSKTGRFFRSYSLLPGENHREAAPCKDLAAISESSGPILTSKFVGDHTQRARAPARQHAFHVSMFQQTVHGAIERGVQNES